VSEPPSLWYFGYGSNTERGTFLGRRRMRPLEVRIGRLDGFELRFDLAVGHGERGVANVAAHADDHVWGVLWRIPVGQAGFLDRTEGLHRGFYRRLPVEVTTPSGETLAAFTYHSLRGRPGRKPSRRYLGLLLAGARQHGLPAEWVERLRSFEPAVDEREQGRLLGERGTRPQDARAGIGPQPVRRSPASWYSRGMGRRVHELMNPDVVCVDPQMPAGAALDLLLARSVADAPVVSGDGRVIGIIGQPALVRHVEARSTVAETGRFFTDDESYQDLGQMADHRTRTPVEKIMSTEIHPVTRETGVAVAANIMRERRLHRLFVTDCGKLIGVITSLDLLRIVEELG
jgi:predicted transcriptional regulator/cation transport regulator ChaC